MKTKQELEQSIVMLEELCEQDVVNSAGNLDELEQAKRDLASFNKPVLTGSQLDDINEAIESAVGDFDFSDHDNYDKEFELDYDGRVQLSSFDFINAQELVEAVTEEVHKLFVEKQEDND